MLKMYHHNSYAGGSPSFWDDTWNQCDEAPHYLTLDPLRFLLDRYARPGMVMLEGGCGNGHYVTHFSARGVKVLGLDFAPGTLARLHASDPRLLLCAGDVATLPFRDESFDLYYSGGVVEHFEGGTDAALREAWRVLRPGAVLLITVPYCSPIRRLASLMKSDWRLIPGPAVDEDNEGRSPQFFQYAYTQREFNCLLAEAGFRVVGMQGYYILWGLHGVPFLWRAMKTLEKCLSSRRCGLSGKPKTDRPIFQTEGEVPSPPLLKRLLICEDDNVPVLGVAVRALRWACANMMLYTCVRNKPMSRE